MYSTVVYNLSVKYLVLWVTKNLQVLKTHFESLKMYNNVHYTKIYNFVIFCVPQSIRYFVLRFYTLV
jgi:hypothetical protein